MSYILDALRKADAQRERDPARGIHAQPAVATPPRSGAQVPRWTWVAAGALVAVTAGYLAWPDAPTPAPVVTAPAPLPVQPAQAMPAPAAPALVVAATSVRPPAPAPVERVAPVRVAAQRTAAAEPAGLVLKAPAPAGAASAPAAPTAALAAPTPAGDRILAVSELPADVQRELPKLVISGGVHSENAAQRMLIVGGQVMTEGAELAPGVVLEQVRARNAVLRFRGLRYSVQF